MTFRDLMQSTITVAPRTGQTDGDPDYGTQEEIRARHETERGEFSAPGGGSAEKIDRVYTDEREFAIDDRIWLPGDDTSKTHEGRTPEDVGHDTTAGLTLYWAEL